MSILFSNPPWWETKESRGLFRKKDGGEVLELDLDGHLLILDDLAPITQKLKTIFLTLIFLVMLVLMLQIKLVKKKFILEIVLRYLSPMKAFINMLTR